MEYKQNLTNKIKALAVAGALGMASNTNAAPIITHTNIGFDTYRLGVLFDMNTTSFILPTTLESLAQFDLIYSDTDSNLDWNGQAVLNPSRNLYDIVYNFDNNGGTIKPGGNGIFSYTINPGKMPLGLTGYDTTLEDATLIGPLYDSSNNKLQVTIPDISREVTAQNPISAPGSASLALLGLAGIAASRRRKYN